MKWISVKDKLPSPEIDVLVVNEKYPAAISIASIYEDIEEDWKTKKLVWSPDNCGCCDPDQGLESFTHWMQLPKLAEEE